MEWSVALTTLFDRIVLRIPAQFRAHVRPLLRRAAEAECEKRQDTRINQTDLATALFEITPVTFKSKALQDLEAMGIDVEALKAKLAPGADLTRMEDDVVAAATVAEAPCSREVVHEVLGAYADEFANSPVTFKTTTKPRGARRLGVRFVKVPGSDSDPFPVAVARGFISRRGRPIHDLLPDITSTFPTIGYGLDVDAELGVAKIWPFLETPAPIEEAFRVATLPQAIAKHTSYFAKHNLGIFSLFALDYLNETVNVYFMLNPATRILTPTRIARMHADLGLVVPSPDLLDRCTRAFTLYFTFGYESDRVQRICFGVSAQNVDDVPSHLDPFIGRFVADVPFLAKDRRFVYSITTGITDSYIKLEADYTGSMIELLTYGAHAVEDVSGSASTSSREVREVPPNSEKWAAYLGRFFAALNALPELMPLLQQVAPLLFEYRVTDRPEMSYWLLMEMNGVRWGLGHHAAGVPTVVHKADFDTIGKVNVGELDPINATAQGRYVVEGDLSRLMMAAPLVPLLPKAHAAAIRAERDDGKAAPNRKRRTEGSVQLIVDSGTDKELIEAILDEDLPVSRVVLHATQGPIGNGSIFLPRILPDREAFEELTELVRGAGVVPIAGIDSTCQANLQDHAEHNAMENAFIERLKGLGYEEFLVSSPNMIGFVKARVPGARVHVSYAQGISTTNRAEILFEFGADVLHLHPDIVRNVPLLKNLLKLSQADLPAGTRKMVLPLNIGCNWGCIHWYQHHNLQSHRTLASPLHPSPESISDVPDGFDYPILDCWRKRLDHPSELLMAGWIPPPDLQRYRELGYDTFLVVTSGLGKSESLGLIRAYAEQAPLDGFERYLAIAHPYGEYWPAESARQALKSLDAEFLSEFCAGFPFDEVYPFESRAEEYCRSLVSRLKSRDEGARALVRRIAEHKMERMTCGVGGAK